MPLSPSSGAPPTLNASVRRPVLDTFKAQDRDIKVSFGRLWALKVSSAVPTAERCLLVSTSAHPSGFFAHAETLTGPGVRGAEPPVSRRFEAKLRLIDPTVIRLHQSSLLLLPAFTGSSKCIARMKVKEEGRDDGIRKRTRAGLVVDADPHGAVVLGRCLRRVGGRQDY